MKKRRKNMILLAAVIMFALLPFFGGLTLFLYDHTIGSKLEEFKAGQGGSSDADRDDKNSGFYSMMGTVMHLNDHVYFVQSGLDNDCSENGSEFSEGIWCISDEQGAEPELLYSVPSNVIEGQPQNTIVDLAGTEEKIWFLKAENGNSREYSLNWVNIRGNESGSVELPAHDWISQVDFDEGRYYIEYTNEKENSTPVTDLWVFDIEKETGENLSVSGGKEKELEFLTVSSDYSYYLKKSSDGNEPLLCREELSTGKTEEITTLDAAVLEDPLYKFFYAEKDCFYYLLDQTLFSVRFSDGGIQEVLDKNLLTDTLYPNWCITETGIWYGTEEGIWFCDPEGGNRVLVKKIKGTVCHGLFAAGDWIYYSLEEQPAYTRIYTGKVDSASGEEKRAGNKDHGIETDNQKTEENGTHCLVTVDRDTLVTRAESNSWIYTVYPAFVEINGYTGGDKEVTLPEELDGLPVRSVRIDSYTDKQMGFVGVKTLNLPSSLTSVSYICIPSLEKIHFPEKLEFFTTGDPFIALNSDCELKISFDGTLDRWKKLCEKSGRYYGGGQDQTGITFLIMSCSDGEYSYDSKTGQYLIPEKSSEQEKAANEEAEEILTEEPAAEEPAAEEPAAQAEELAFNYGMVTGVSFHYTSGNGRFYYRFNVFEDGSFEGVCNVTDHNFDTNTGNYDVSGKFSHFTGRFGALEYVSDTEFRTYVESLTVDTPTGTQEFGESGYLVTYIEPESIAQGDEIIFYLPSALNQQIHYLDHFGGWTYNGPGDPGDPIGTYAFADVPHNIGFEGIERRPISTSWASY